MKIGTVEGLLKLRDEFSKQIDLASAKMELAGRRAQQVGQQMSTAGTKLTLGLTVPLVAAGAAAFKLSRDLGDTMVRIETLVGLSTETVSGLKDEVLDLAGATAKSPKELAEGLYFLTSAGLSARESMDALVSSAQASALGMGDTASVANAVSSVMNAYGANVMSSAKATNVLALAVRAGKLEAAELAPVMGRVVPMAAAMGVAFEDLAGSLAAMSRTGLNAAESAVSINAFLSLLARGGSKEAQEMMEQLGLSMSQLRAIIRQPGGLIEAMRLLHERTQNFSEEALARVIPEIRALRGVMNIMAQDAGSVDQVMRDVASGVDVLDSGMKRLEETIGFKLDKSLTEMRINLTKLGDAMAPAFEVGIKMIGGFSAAVGKLVGVFAWAPKAVQGLVLVIGGLAAAIGPLLFVTGQLITAWGTLLWQAPRLAGAIKLVGVAISRWILPYVAVLVALNEALRRIRNELDKDIAALVKGSAEAGKAYAELRRIQLGIREGAAPTATVDQFEQLAKGWKSATAEAERLRKKLEEVRQTHWIAEDDPRIRELEVQLGNAERQAQKFKEAFFAAKPALSAVAAVANDVTTPAVKVLSDEAKDLIAAYNDLRGALEPNVGIAMKYAEQQELLKAAFKLLNVPIAEQTRLLKLLGAEAKKAFDEIAKSPFGKPGFGTGQLPIFGTTGKPLAIIDTRNLELARQATERLLGPTERLRKTLDEINRSNLEGELRIQAVINATAKYREETQKLADSLAPGKTNPMAVALEGIVKNFYEGLQRAFADTIFEFLRKGDVSLKSFWETFKELGLRAIAELAAKWAATKFATSFSGDGGTGGTGWLGWAQKAFGAYKAWQGGGSFWGSLFGGGGTAATTATGTASTSVTAMQGTTWGTTASTSTASSAGAATGALWAAAFFAAVVLVSRKQLADTQKKLLFQTAASVKLTDGEIQTAVAGRLKGTAKKIVEALAAGVEGAVEALGTGGVFVRALDQITVLARNDKKLFEVRVGELMLGRFGSMNDAILAGIRYAFLSGPEAAQLDERIRQVFLGYSGAAEKIGEAIGLVQSAIDEAGGIQSGSVESSIRGMANALADLRVALMEAGLTALQATELFAGVGVERFTQAWNSLAGIEQTPEQLRQQAEARRALLIAELELFKIQLQQREAFLRAEAERIKTEGTLGTIEIETWRGFLRGKEILVRAGAKLYEAELAVIAAALKQIDVLLGTIRTGKIKIPSLTRSVSDLGNAASRAREELASAKEALLDFLKSLRTTSEFASGGLAPTERLFFARRQFEDTLRLAQSGDVEAMRELQKRSQEFLSVGSDLFGTGSGFQTIFQQVVGGLESIVGHGLEMGLEVDAQTAHNTAQLVDGQNHQIQLAEATLDAAAATTRQVAYGSDAVVKAIVSAQAKTDAELARLRLTLDDYLARAS